jgi:hypothetical protein
VAKVGCGIGLEEAGDEGRQVAGVEGGCVVGMHEEGGVHRFEVGCGR